MNMKDACKKARICLTYSLFYDLTNPSSSYYIGVLFILSYCATTIVTQILVRMFYDI